MNIEKAIAIILAVAVFAGLGAYALNAGITDVDTDNAQQALPEIVVDETEVEVEEFEFRTDLPFDVEFDGLEPLDGALYEGWIVKGEDQLSFGTFNTNTFGEISGDLVTNETVENGDQVVITIEPLPDDSPDPSPTVILAGTIEDGEAELAFPIDTSDFAGNYILATPSDGEGNNEEAGIWFIDNSDGLEAGLEIPNAPEGWIYEGWIVIDEIPYSTGKFTDPATADDFNGFSGPEPTPEFPGEDFLANLPNGLEAPYDLNDGRVTTVLSIEPFINGIDPTGDGPAQAKPLSVRIPLDLDDHTISELELTQEGIPSGSVVADDLVPAN